MITFKSRSRSLMKNIIDHHDKTFSSTKQDVCIPLLKSEWGFAMFMTPSPKFEHCLCALATKVRMSQNETILKQFPFGICDITKHYHCAVTDLRIIL